MTTVAFLFDSTGWTHPLKQKQNKKTETEAIENPVSPPFACHTWHPVISGALSLEYPVDYDVNNPNYNTTVAATTRLKPLRKHRHRLEFSGVLLCAVLGVFQGG